MTETTTNSPTEVLNRLIHAITTMWNDDRSSPRTEGRERIMARDSAMADAASLLYEMPALIHDNARLVATNAQLATENAALLRERDAQAKVIALIDEKTFALTEHRGENYVGDCPLCVAIRAYDAARAGLNTQGSGK